MGESNDKTHDRTRVDRIQRLRGEENYHIWKFGVTILFRSSGVYGVVTGTTPKPVAVADLVAWNKRDGYGQELIISTIEEKVVVHILRCSSANEMWNKLKNLYEKLDEEQKCLLQTEFLNTRFEKGETVAIFLSRIQNLFHRLKAFDAHVDDGFLVNKIICSLPSRYSGFVTAWRLDKNRKLDDLVTSLMAEEAGNKPKENTESVAFFAKPTSQQPTSAKECYRCKKLGHLKKDCKVRIDLKCGKCNGLGHESKNCKVKTSGTGFSHNRNRSFVHAKKENKIAFLTYDEDEINPDWIVDSGATSHMTNDQNLLSEVQQIESHISTASEGNSLETSLIGKVETNSFILDEVMFAKKLKKNLLSVSAIVDRNCSVTFMKDRVLIQRDGRTLLQGGRLQNGLFNVNLHSTDEVNQTYLAEINKPGWHEKLGHLGLENVRKLSRMCDGMQLSAKEISAKKFECDTCVIAKQVRSPFGNERTRALRVFERVHTDICGPIDPPTWDNFSYFAVFVDDYSGFVQVKLLSHKSDLFEALVDYVTEIEVNKIVRLSTIRCDNGGEFISNALKAWCKKRGIILDYNPPYSPQLGGRAERMNRILIEKVRAMLIAAKAPRELWGEAVYTAAFLANRSPRANLPVTPYELWCEKRPNLRYLQVFGSPAYAKILSYRKKLEDRSRKLMFVGYASNAYRLWDADYRCIKVSRDVTVFSLEKELKPVDSNFFDFRDLLIRDPIEEIDEDGSSTTQQSDEQTAEQVSHQEDSQLDASLESADTTFTQGSGSEWTPSTDDELNDTVIESAGDAGNRYPERGRQPPQRFPEPELLFTADLVSGLEPLTVSEALANSNPEKGEWLTAMAEEFESIEANGTWILVELPKGKKAVKCKWVFKRKRDATGNIERYKCRLVAKGYSQIEGVDYQETFSPVIRHATFRFLIAIAAKMNLNIHHMDVICAFLNGDLEEEIYLEQPENFVKKGQEKYVYLLKKALYGLKQASQAWNKNVSNFLLSLGFEQSKLEHCVYFKISNNVILILALYVDDFFLLFNCTDSANKLKKELMLKYKMKDLGLISKALGINFKFEGQAIKLSQEQYIKKLLSDFGMTDCKTVNTPLEVKNKLVAEIEEPLTDIPYQNLIGGLMYLVVSTRPDIAYSVSYLSQFNRCPSKTHWIQAKRILRYLKGTIDKCLVYTKNVSDFTGFVDADWGGGEGRKSFSGFVYFLANGPVSWAAQKQKVVALSSTEAEYIGITEASKDAVFLSNLHVELFGQSIHPLLYNDNQSALKMARNPIFHGKSKHIDIRHHYIRELIKNGRLTLKYLRTDEMTADIFTKALGSTKHIYFLDKLLK